MMHEAIRPVFDQLSLAEGRSRRSNFGQDNREKYRDTTDYLERILEDVPADELQAAIEDEVSSMSRSEQEDGDTWETASEGSSGIDDDLATTGHGWGEQDGDFQPENQNVIFPQSDTGNLGAEIFNVSQTNEATDDSDVTVTDEGTLTSDFESDRSTDTDLDDQIRSEEPISVTDELQLVTLDDETLDRWDYALGTARVEGDDDDSDEDLETILSREAIEEGMSNVSIYTPPATQASDLARDLQEQKTDEMAPRRLFEAGYREDGLAIGESAHDVNGDLADVEPANVNSVSPSGLETIAQMVLPNSSGEAMMANVTKSE